MCHFEIEFRREVALSDALVIQLKSAIKAALVHEGVAPPADLTLLITDDERLRELNQKYRGIDSATDVLSFAAGEAMPGMEDLPRYLGDIVISQPYAARQAASGKHSLAAELQLLAIHGVLHLLGHDHAEPEEKQRMWQIQAAVLSQLGLPAITPAEDDHA